ncbi:MAG: hypothetical protein AB3N23_06595 [Paracoccaceae bacterium]
MTAIAFPLFSGWAKPAPAQDTRVETAPPPRRYPPVFIHDAVMPWQGETMLLSLLRAQALDSMQGDDDQT